jgi:tetratricopeptide (TPR) repeat protein
MTADDALTRRSEAVAGADADVTRFEASASPSSAEGLSASLLPGALIGRFVVIGGLGQGGMAVVVQAYDPELDRKVAIKVMRGEVFGERGSLGQARMLREAQALAKLSHPNIVQCFEVGKVSGGVFIAMELIRGVNLRTWLKEKPRGWREVARVFAQAGEGLAAAHAAGIVHRDVKPDNLLVGEDGRVRVLDFGLARPEGGEAAPGPAAAAQTSSQEVTLTEVGSLVGTPAYMAPEQQLGQEADARSDVFGLCVSLYEALYGHRPFRGISSDEVRRRVVLGQIEAPPRDVKVPAWLHAVVRRGLAREPAARYPSMQALLAELTRDRVTTRRRWGLGAAFVGLGLGWAGTAALSGGAAGRCEAAAEAMIGVWDPARREAVRAAMSGSDVAFAGATWTRVEAALDAYAGSWVAEARGFCLAEEAGEEAVDERGELCLARRREELRALVDVLAEGSAEAIEHALQAVGHMPPTSSCHDAAALAADTAAPPRPEDLMAVTALRERLTRVQAAEWAGRYLSVLEDSELIAREAAALAYAPLLAEALLRRATLLTRVGEYAAAEEALVDAYAAAEAAGQELLRAEVLVLRLELVGFLMAKPAEVRAWIPAVSALVRRIRPESALEGRLLANIGLVEAAAGRLVEAEVQQRRALELAERTLAADDPERVNALFQLGRTLYRSGGKDALTVLEEARVLAEQILGPEHPALVPIYLNVANAWGSRDREKLSGYYRKSLALAEKVLGPRHPMVASALGNIANTQMYDNRVDEAVPNYRRAVEIHRATLGESHPTTAINMCNLAEGLMVAGELAEAREWYTRAQEVFERAHREPHPETSLAIGGLGETMEAEGRWEEARVLYHRAVELSLSGPGKPPYFAFDWLRRERAAQMALGQFADAAATSGRLIALAEGHHGPPVISGYRLLRAQALASAGDGEAAVAEAEGAIAALREVAGGEGVIAQIEAWLAEQAARPTAARRGG